MAALAMATLVDKGLLDYDDKVTKHWPEFANVPPQADRHHKAKEDLTVADVLRHEAGLANFKRKFASEESMLPENMKKNEVGEVIETEECRYTVYSTT